MPAENPFKSFGGQIPEQNPADTAEDLPVIPEPGVDQTTAGEKLPKLNLGDIIELSDGRIVQVASYYPASDSYQVIKMGMPSASKVISFAVPRVKAEEAKLVSRFVPPKSNEPDAGIKRPRVHTPPQKIPEVSWGHSDAAIERIFHSEAAYEEPDAESLTGIFKGRRIISRDEPINGGVYVGGSQREAIVVDDQNGNAMIGGLYRDLAAEYGEDVRMLKKVFLGEVYERTRKQWLPYDKQKVDDLVMAGGWKGDKKVNLENFIRAQAGVCRHQALLVAYLIEKAIYEKVLDGKVSIDRNTVKGVGGHAWVRYTKANGEVIIIDPAQNFLGKLSDVDPVRNWFYQRPEDVAAQNKKRAGERFE